MTKFNADATLSGSVTGLYLTRAPQNTAFPYMTFSLVANDPGWVFSGKAMEDALIQFSIFTQSRSAVSACTIYGYLTSCFDWAALTVSGHTCVMLKREVSGLTQEDEKTWHYSVQYHVMLQES